MSIPFGCPFSDPLHSKRSACLLLREPGLPCEPSDGSCPACVAMFCAHPCTPRRTMRIRSCVSLTFVSASCLFACSGCCSQRSTMLHFALPWAYHCDIYSLVATLAPRSDTYLLGLSMSRLPLKSRRISLIRTCSL